MVRPGLLLSEQLTLPYTTAWGKCEIFLTKIPSLKNQQGNRDPYIIHLNIALYMVISLYLGGKSHVSNGCKMYLLRSPGEKNDSFPPHGSSEARSSASVQAGASRSPRLAPDGATLLLADEVRVQASASAASHFQGKPTGETRPFRRPFKRKTRRKATPPKKEDKGKMSLIRFIKGLKNNPRKTTN